MGGLQQTIAKIGTALVAAFAAKVVFDFLKDSVQAFTEFEAATTKMFATMDPLPEETKNRLVGEIKDISNEYGIMATKVTAAYDVAGDLGVPLDSLKTFIPFAADLSKVLGTDVEQAASVLAKTVQGLGGDFSRTEEVANLFFQVAEKGDTDIGTLQTTFAKLLPVAQDMGISFNELGAYIATIAQQGVPTRTAISGIQAAMDELSDPTTKVATMFQELSGTTIRDFISSGGTLSEALGLIAANAEATGTPLTDLFTNIEAAKTVMLTTGDKAALLAQNLDTMASSAGGVATAYDNMAETTEQRMLRMKTTLDNLKIDLGGKIMEALQPVIQWIADHTDDIKAFFDIVGRSIQVVLSIVGPVVESLLSLLNGVLAFLRGDWAGAWDGLKGFFTGLFDALNVIFHAFWDPVVNIFSGAFEAVETFFTGLWDKFLAWGQGLVDAIWQGIQGAWHKVTEFFANAWDSLIAALTSWMPGFLKKWLGIGEDSAQQYADGLAASEATITGAATDVGDAAVAAIVAAIGQGETTVADAGSTLGVSLTEGLSLGLGQGMPSLLDDVTFMGDSVIDTLGLTFESQSPSKKTAEIGRDVAAGLGIGITEGTPGVITAAETLAQSALTAFGTKVESSLVSSLSDLGYKLVTFNTTREQEEAQHVTNLEKIRNDSSIKTQADLDAALAAEETRFAENKTTVEGIWSSVWTNLKDAVLKAGINEAAQFVVDFFKNTFAPSVAAAMTTASAAVQTGTATMASSLGALLLPITAVAGALAVISDIISGKATISGAIGDWLDDIFAPWHMHAGTVYKNGVPQYASGGIVSGAMGQPQLAVVHGGEPIGAKGFAQAMDYGAFAEAVQAGVYDAMAELGMGADRPMILQVDGKTFGRIALPLVQREKVRLGLEAV
jgi:TP901 family phage tail tape measure protein